MATWRNTHDHYGRMTKLIHWTMAALFIALIATGVIADNLPRGELRGTLFALHRSLGVSIIPFVIWRLVWHFISPPPEHLPMPAWQVNAAKAVHYLLYAIMITQPLTGLFMYLFGERDIVVFGLITIPAFLQGNEPLADFLRATHEWTAFAIYAAVALHIGAALQHHFILKDGVLKRMLSSEK